MKRLIILLSPCLFFLLTSCSDGDPEAPPPQPPQLNLNNPNDQRSLLELQMMAQQARKNCTKSMGPGFLQIAVLLSKSNNSPDISSMLLPQLLGGDQCSNDIDNMLMIFSTLAQGQYQKFPESRAYIISQVSGVVGGLRSLLESNGIQITPKLQKQLTVYAVRIYKEKLGPKLNQNFQSGISSSLQDFLPG